MAGSGEVIPNGSIHYNIIHDESNRQSKERYVLRAVDPTPLKEVGATKDHAGKLRVRLRFASEREARAAMMRAAENVQFDRASRTWEAVVDLTPVQRTKKQAEEPP